MKFSIFLRAFSRVRSPEPEDTEIRFMCNKQELIVATQEFDVAHNTWVINLRERS
jgi:hypothetical protein